MQALQLLTGFLIGKLAAIHFQKMACCRECTPYARKIGSGGKGTVRQRKFRNEVTLRCILAGDVKLSLQVLLSDLQIAQSHAVNLPPRLRQTLKTLFAVRWKLI